MLTKILAAAKVGDTVIMKATVLSKSGGLTKLNFGHGNMLNLLHEREVEDIIPGPWVMEIGSIVKYKTGSLNYEVRAFSDDYVMIKSTSGEHYTAHKETLTRGD